MTERLQNLLREEATSVVVPPVNPDAIRRQARGLRHRRRTVETLAILAAVGSVVAGVAIGFGPNHASNAQHRYATATAGAAYRDYGAFAVGSTVYIGNHHVTFEEKIKALYYTSQGVLVRGGKVAETDASGLSHYTLVRPDGSTRTVDLRMGDRVPGTDAQSPNVAYAEPAGDRWALVVVSLATGDEVARTTVDGRFTWGGWEAPPVTLSGDRMWALFDNGWREFDWTTGATRIIPGTANAPLTAANGRFALYNDMAGHTDWQVKDFVTGELVATVPTHSNEDGADIGWLSPDGHYVRLQREMPSYDGQTGKLISAGGPSRFYSLDTGRVVTIPAPALYGWTPDGHTLSVDTATDTVTLCDPGTGVCEELDVAIAGGGRVKLGGLSYES